MTVSFKSLISKKNMFNIMKIDNAIAEHKDFNY